VSSNSKNGVASAKWGCSGRCCRQSIRLKTKYGYVSRGIAPYERRLYRPAAGKGQFEVVVILQSFFGGDGDARAPMNSA
jgi:hypothetical protein